LTYATNTPLSLSSSLYLIHRQGKIAIEFEVLIGLRILGRDACADDIDELLNIRGSTVNNIFKQFVKGCQEKLCSKHVHVPEGAALEKVVQTYTM
jgi:hypothetical protein